MTASKLSILPFEISEIEVINLEIEQLLGAEIAETDLSVDSIDDLYSKKQLALTRLLQWMEKEESKAILESNQDQWKTSIGKLAEHEHKFGQRFLESADVIQSKIRTIRQQKTLFLYSRTNP